MQLEDIRSNEAIGAWIEHVGGTREVLATTELGEPVWVGKFGGDKQPPIVITAGSHADEVAGVFAALKLAQDLATDHTVYIIPCRDPLGWNGFADTLQRVAPSAGIVTSYEAAAEVLRSGDVIFDDGSFVISRVGGLTFATEPGKKWLSTQITRHKLPQMLKDDPELAAKLRNTRILVPGNVEVEDGRTPYTYGGHTAYIGDGFFAQLNRFFDREDGPIEVTALRSFVDKVKPGLSIDLHEGFSSSYYLFVHAASSPETYKLAEVMINAVRAKGLPIATREELEPIWGPKSSAGILTKGEGIFAMGPPSADEHASFSGYCDKYGVSLTTESGMEAPVPVRVEMIETASRAVIEAFANT